MNFVGQPHIFILIATMYLNYLRRLLCFFCKGNFAFTLMKILNMCVCVCIHYYGLPRWLMGKESICSTGGVGLIPG